MLLNLILLFFVATTAYADDRAVAVTQALTKVQEKVADQNSWEGQNADQPYVTLLSEYETVINPDWSYTENYHIRIRVQQDGGKDLGTWPIFYNKSREEIKEIKAFVETPDGKRQEATRIEDVPAYDDSVMYGDMMVKLVTLPELSIGSMLDVSVKSRVKSKEITNHFFDEVVYPGVPTKFARFTYIFPENKNIVFKNHASDYKPIIEKLDGRIKYSFVFEETKEIAQELLMPPLSEIEGGLYLSSITDWKDVADWFRRLTIKNIVEDEAIVKKVQDLIKDAKTPMDRARAIVEFIQNSFRYVALNFGDHMVEPHNIVQVYRERYGDSKDISLLVKYMLEIAQIKANIALMNSEFSPNPLNVLPTPSIFEHVILEVDIEGKKVFIDPVIRGFDIGQFPADFDNANIFVIEDTGIFRFEKMPIADAIEHQLINKTEVTVKANGSAIFDVKVTLPIEASQSFRSQWEEMSEEDKNEFYNGMRLSFAKDGRMISHKAIGLEQRYGPVEFQLQYESPKAYPIVNNMLLLKEQQQNDLPMFEAEQRLYPIFFPTNSTINTTYVYHVPEGLKVDFVPKSYVLKFDFADITVDYVVVAKMVTMTSNYVIKRSTIDPKRYQEVKDFRNEIQKKNDQYIVLKIE